ncbi:MAG: hypothetical protein UHS49_05115 [Faecalimonas sp.]|nr:hypothetical protein [Faecalimonas sp.]
MKKFIKSKKGKIIAGIVALIILIGIAVGIVLLCKPADEKTNKTDIEMYEKDKNTVEEIMEEGLTPSDSDNVNGPTNENFVQVPELEGEGTTTPSGEANDNREPNGQDGNDAGASEENPSEEKPNEEPDNALDQGQESGQWGILY